MSDPKLEFSRGETIAEQYEVIDLLDESPLGLTYRVKHLEKGRYLRLTLIKPSIAGPDRKDDILEAYKKARSIEHRHLLKVGQLGENEGVAFFTAEDFEGGSLRELLQEYKVSGKQFALKEAASIAIQILEAVGAANEAGFYYRALRPEYVLVHIKRTGPRQANVIAQVRVFGAGFFELIDSAALAEDEFARGEAQYIAPELKSFEPEPSNRSDVYSIGVVFYEMLTGVAPVGTFVLPKKRRPDLPDHINDVVEMAMAQAPEDRYGAAVDFVADIQRTFQDAGLDEEPVRRPLITPIGWGIALVAVLLIGVILFALRSDPKADAQTADQNLRVQIYEEHPHPGADEVQAVLANHPPNMIYIPPGPYLAGRLNSEADAPRGEPLAERSDLHGFLIDAFEHPNLKGGTPTRKVGQTAAQAACQEQGKRLCTAEEWEKACKGPKNLIYGYSDAFDATKCGNGLEDPKKSGERQHCKAGWGSGEYDVYDMAGNFREWTSSAPNSSARRRIVKGGIPLNPAKGTRCAFTTDLNAELADAALSFRCCRDLDAPPAPKQKAKGKGKKGKKKQ